MRRGGLALVTIVFLGALARMLAPQSQSTSETQPSAIPSTPLKASNPPVTKSAPPFPEQWYPFVLSEKIRDFFGQEHSPDVVGQEPPCGTFNLSQKEYANPNLYLDRVHWCVPELQRGNLRFVIATVPDPVHTHLSLFFDRSIDAIEQGASSQGYTFDRAVMPWHYFDDPNSTEAGYQAKLRESFPGLMIFRSEASVKPPLFILIVGETPTAGINEEQFHHSLEIIHDIRQGVEPSIQSAAPEFGVLGPTFSGSLYSLRMILNTYLSKTEIAASYSQGRTLPVYATVMGTDSIKAFQAQTSNLVRMSIFQEDATVALAALSQFVSGDLKYKESEIAVLNEDETKYGSSFGTPYQSPIGANNQALSDVLILLYPRGISQFRSEYSKEFQTTSAQNGTSNGNQQERRNLRLDLEVTGSDDDSVAPYGKSQTAMSQEAVMLAIVSELRLRQSKFILLRATDPLDELFLARYLRNNYPQGRLVVPTPDLLFPRDEGGELDGVLELSTYPLSPSKMNPNLVQLCNRSDSVPTPLIFPASSSAALYNALSMLIFRLEEQTSEKPAETKPGIGVPVESDSSCKMSPDTYLTIVNRNSIRPVKILGVNTPSTFYASSGVHLSDQKPQRDANTPATWYFTFLACFVLLYIHFKRSWTGGKLGLWQTPGQFDPPGRPLGRKAWIVCLGGIILVGIFVVLVSPYTPVWGDLRSEHPLRSTLILWAIPAAFVTFTCWDFWKRRGERLLSVLFLIFAALASVSVDYFSLPNHTQMVLWQQRALDLASGVSPATPIVVILLGLYVWFRYSLRGESLVDWRCPRLPEKTELPEDYKRLADSVNPIRRSLRPFCYTWPILDSIVLVALLNLALIPWFDSAHVPVRSVEGLAFDKAYSILLGLAILILVGTVLRLVALWFQFRWLLSGLDRVGLRDALRRLTGFEWKIIWNPAWSVEREGYKLITREIQTIQRLRMSLEESKVVDREKNDLLSGHIEEILALSRKIFDLTSGGKYSNALPSATRLMVPFENIQRKFAETAGLLSRSFLDKSWQNLPAENESKGPAEDSPKSSCTEINVGTALIKVGAGGEADPPPADPSGLSQKSLGLAEEFTACVYANFLVTVLMRVRGLVFTSVVLYVCIVFSTISYPFQPAPDLNMLAIVLFLLSGGAIGFVYEEMHRDPTLSRLTSTDPGKLDSDFWVKFGAAGFAPFVALVSTVYPPFGHLLYSLVGPLLQALR